MVALVQVLVTTHRSYGAARQNQRLDIPKAQRFLEKLSSNTTRCRLPVDPQYLDRPTVEVPEEIQVHHIMGVALVP